MAGFGLSPVMASMLESMGFAISHAFFTMSVVCVISGLIFILLKSTIRGLVIDPGSSTRSSLTLATVAKVFATPARLPLIMVCLGARVFAGMNNFQTVFADNRGLNYADFFLASIGYHFPMRFFNHLGATEVNPDSVCNLAGHLALEYVYGSSVDGFDPRTVKDSNCVMVWGVNPANAGPPCF